MQHVAIVLEHVHLLHSGDGLQVELLEGSLQLLVVACTADCRFLDDLPSRCTLSACRSSIPSTRASYVRVGDDRVCKYSGTREKRNRLAFSAFRYLFKHIPPGFMTRVTSVTTAA